MGGDPERGQRGSDTEHSPSAEVGLPRIPLPSRRIHIRAHATPWWRGCFDPSDNNNPEAMRTTILLACGLFAATVQAQCDACPRLSASLTDALRAEVATMLGNDQVLTCTVTGYNEGGAGTGAALVMYSPAHAQLDAVLHITDKITGEEVWTCALHATGRTSEAEALERALELAMERVAAAAMRSTRNAQGRELAGR